MSPSAAKPKTHAAAAQPLPDGLSETLQKLGYSTLNPLQQKAVAEGYLEAPRTLVSAPTASGKTLLALLSITRHFEQSKTGVFYVVPLRALASEKYREFKTALSSFGLTVGISTGDFDSNSPNLQEYDVVLVTSEKLDSLLRHDRSWLERIGLVVLDEVHLIGDGSRGATLEVVLTKLKNAGTKILALSATIPNDQEFADWLSAKLVQSSYRPTPLLMGLCDGKNLYMEDESVTPLKGLAAKALCEKALAEKNGKGQGIFFVSTRRFTESLARQLAPTTALFLTAEEKTQCAVLAQRALRTFATPTAQCKSLSESLQSGVAFHHAGLPQKQRDLIEDGFREHRCLKVLCATTTLAAGLDLPASWVIVRDTKRFNGSYSEHIPKIELCQMAGRAGRPRFDAKGTAVIMCQPYEIGAVRDKYILGELEKIYSQLSAEPSLRSHALGLLASGYA
ncbi:MAG: DEAD/DEAH box helicase, partial [Candidatus Micrarchaeota archaeon]|nr:DEAD/DEAH box helicase [Candidatus Micrarchaeota archaeon]